MRTYTRIMGWAWLALAIGMLVMGFKEAFWAALTISGVWLAANSVIATIEKEDRR